MAFMAPQHKMSATGLVRKQVFIDLFIWMLIIWGRNAPTFSPWKQ